MQKKVCVCIVTACLQGMIVVPQAHKDIENGRVILRETQPKIGSPMAIVDVRLSDRYGNE